MDLSSEEEAMLRGDSGEALQIAMRIVTSVGRAEKAERLIPIEGAHIDGCLYHGQSGIDFARKLVDGGGRVRVPTTLNVAAIDLLHPELFRGDPETARGSRELMDAYVQLGCEPTWTCAPYQQVNRPAEGQQIAWGESNAIVFANSVLGARTNRYGDFMDICCALTGRAPDFGLHTNEGRFASVVVQLDLADEDLGSDATYPLLGYALGQVAGTSIPAIVGLDERATEDRLRALGAAASSSGAVAMFHAVGVTPEAPDLQTALGGNTPELEIRLEREDLNGARRRLTGSEDRLGAVSVGTPHMSLEELARLTGLVAGSESRVPFYVNTSRGTLAQAESRGLAEPLREFGATFVTDTCTYITPIIGDVEGAVMTDSAKWAHYAPANIGVEVVFGSLDECVRSAVGGSLAIGSPPL